MYSLNNKKDYIKSIQKYLLSVYPKEHIPQNGIYEDRTRDQIIKFQKDSGLTENGVIDDRTLRMLYNASKKQIQSKKLPKNENLKYRYYDEQMREINQIIAELLNYYGKHHRLLPLPYFSEETVLSVNELRRIYSLDSSDEIDEELYSIMIKDYNSLL